MSALPDARAVSISTAGYEDGLGRRSVRFDREVGGMLECLHLRPELRAFEASLRERADAIGRLDDERFVPVRAIERDHHGLTVISELVPGERLLDVIEARQREAAAVFGLDAALGLLLQALPALSTLHAAGMAHGLVSPGRLLVTPASRIVLLDGIYAAAVERINLSRRALWSTLGILGSPVAGASRLDRQTDIVQVALAALVLATGKAVTSADPAALAALVRDAAEVGEIRAGAEFAVRVRQFFTATLPLGGRRPVIGTDDASFEAQNLAALVGEESCHAALADLTRIEAPGRPGPPALPVEPKLVIVHPAKPQEEAKPAGPVEDVVATPRITPAPPVAPVPPVSPAPITAAPAPPAEAPPVVAAEPAPILLPAVTAAPHLTEPPVAAPTTPTIIDSPQSQAPATAPQPPAIEPTPTPIAVAAPPVQAAMIAQTVVSVPAVPVPAAAPPAVHVAPPQPIGIAPQPSRPSPPPLAAPPMVPPPLAAPPAITVAPPQPIGVAAPPPALRVRQEPPPGFAPVRQGPDALHALPFVDRAREEQPSRFPWKLAAAAIVVLAVGILAGRAYLPSAPEPAYPDEAPASVTTAGIPAPPTAPAAATGGLAIDSQPTGARVAIDGKEVGVTPLSLDGIEPGRRSITLSTPTVTVTRTVRVEAGRVTTLEIPVYSGWVAVFSPIVLDVATGGRTIGSTETGKIMLPPGRHVLTLSNRELGYSETRSVEIHPGEERPLNVEPKSAVNINAHPWAEVWIDGRKAGDTPIANLPVLLGTRVFTFKHPQFGERRVTMRISATPSAISVDLTRPE